MAGVNFQRRHYQFIADTIKFLNLPEDTIKQIAEEFTKALKGTNPNFQKTRFMEACGIPVDQINPGI